MADRCPHECRAMSGAVLRCLHDEGHPLPHSSSDGQKWVTAQWGGHHLPCARCAELKMAIEELKECLAAAQAAVGKP